MRASVVRLSTALEVGSYGGGRATRCHSTRHVQRSGQGMRERSLGWIVRGAALYLECELVLHLLVRRLPQTRDMRGRQHCVSRPWAMGGGLHAPPSMTRPRCRCQPPHTRAPAEFVQSASASRSAYGGTFLLFLNISTYNNSYEEMIFPPWIYTFSYLLGNLMILIASLLSIFSAYKYAKVTKNFMKEKDGI